MKTNKLTLKEEFEPINMTVGRLRMAIKYAKPIERQLSLLEKISNDVELLGVKHPESILF